MITGQLAAPAADDNTTHRAWREGARAGLLATGAGALWSLIVDLAVGHPFRTWSFLGAEFVSVLGPAAPPPPPIVAVVVFLAVVTLVFMLLGRIAVGVAHRSDTQPSLVLLANTVLTLIVLAIFVFTVAFTTSRLGGEAWFQILGSPLIALWMLAFRVYRTHPSLALDVKRVLDA